MLRKKKGKNTISLKKKKQRIVFSRIMYRFEGLFTENLIQLFPSYFWKKGTNRRMEEMLCEERNIYMKI